MGIEARHNAHSRESVIELSPVMFDRLQRPVQIGDAVLLPGVSATLIWEVVDVCPVVDPRAPRNVARLSVRTTFHLTGAVQQPIAEVILVRAASEREPVVTYRDAPRLSVWQTFVAAFREARGRWNR